ncbi:MAG: 4-carboxy-4-hydroxy-2-oxoadipate aldolase/oxaloacetate decarboxylase [Janthinobacterium lividum]
MNVKTNTLGVVVRHIARPDPALVQRVGAFSVATLHEAMGRTGLMRPYIRPAYPGARLYGSVLTVLAQPGDNLMLHVAAEQIQEGDIVVIACTSDNTDGLFGELLATSYRARGAKGLITDAGVRDTEALAEMDFPVFSRAISAKGAVKAALGSVNVPVVIAGLNVAPGDIVVADADGVVVVPRESAEQTVAAARKREDGEAQKRARFAAGELGLDMYDMRPMLEKLGMKYLD